MVKKDIIALLAVRCSLKVKDATVIVEKIIDKIRDILVTGDRIEIRGLGTLATKTRRARAGRNPKSGSNVAVPPRRATYFKAAKELKKRLNEIPS